jgi:DNA repair protein RadA/Sms
MYIEKPDAAEVDVNHGKVIPMDSLPERARKLLLNVGGTAYGGDFSKQDSAAITSMLTAGIKPADIFSTFAKSPRGRHAEERKPGHFEDYLTRTIEKAAGYIGQSNGHVQTSEKQGSIKIDFAKRDSSEKRVGLITRKMSDIELTKVKWLWPKYIPAGKITILAGDPSLGKSTLMIDLAARITRGALMPDNARGVTGNCIIASAEDTSDDTILPRFLAAQGVTKRFEAIEEIVDDEDSPSRHISFPRDLEMIRQKLIDTGCRLMIIDPLDAFLGLDVDTHKNADIRRTLHPLEKVAEETGTAIVILAHLKKSGQADNALYRIGGSIGLTAAARSVLGVTEVNGKRIFHPLKFNLVKKPTAMEYQVVNVHKESNTLYSWKGDTSFDVGGIEWIGEVEYDPNSKSVASDNDPKTQAAIDYLTTVLQESGTQPSQDIFKGARAISIEKAYISRAKEILEIGHKKVGDVWWWTWPMPEK